MNNHLPSTGGRAGLDATPRTSAHKRNRRRYFVSATRLWFLTPAQRAEMDAADREFFGEELYACRFLGQPSTAQAPTTESSRP